MLGFHIVTFHHVKQKLWYLKGSRLAVELLYKVNTERKWQFAKNVADRELSATPLELTATSV